MVLLDLDNTIINSLSIPDHEIDKVPTEYQDKFISHVMKRYYRIFERPYLQQFLDYLFENFKVSIFTAADKDYALYITENIILTKPERQLSHFFYAYHSELSENIFESPKDLRLIWNVLEAEGFNRDNTIIIDDLEEVYAANPNNTIRAPRFELLKDNKSIDYTSFYDTFLLSTIIELERRLVKSIPLSRLMTDKDPTLKIRTR
jgi:TFIIF-interacting CTD phosphatase-like protein